MLSLFRKGARYDSAKLLLLGSSINVQRSIQIGVPKVVRIYMSV